MLISFRTPLRLGMELGYRDVELFLYAPMNYVQVHVRETWVVIPIEDVDYDPISDEEGVPKPGKEYTKGASTWGLKISHDSGWREAVRQFLAERQENLLSFSGLDWYRVVPVTEVGVSA